MDRRLAYAPAFLLIGIVAIATAGCRREGCLGGDDGECLPASACPALRYGSCGASQSQLKVVRLGDDLQRSPGAKALASRGDFALENDLVRVILDAPDHPHHLAPSGGGILDLAPAGTTLGGTGGDQVNAIFQVAGVLPRDAVHYFTAHSEEHGGETPEEAHVAVIFRGHLEGDARVTVVTRYELRLCEPGVRVRTELYNGAPDPNTLYLTDALFWGDRGLVPFVPVDGMGFRAPELELLHLDRAWRQWPFLAARSQAPPLSSYAIVPCDRPNSAGFNNETLSAAGTPLAPTLPGDAVAYERFILAAPGAGLAPAVEQALQVRSLVHGEPPPVTVTGRVVTGGVPVEGQSGRGASLLFYEPAFGANPDDEARRKPWSEAVPGLGGRFTVTLPANRSYRVQPHAFGRPASAASSFVVGAGGGAPVDIGDITITASARLKATVDLVPRQPANASYVELVVVPFDAPTPANRASLYGLFPGCDPMLGPPHGGTPACNRALTSDGNFDVLLPAGHYFVYATAGPFASIDRQEINVGPGGVAQLELRVETLQGLLPDGVLSADFHVHGAASFDSSIPDQDRVVSFMTAGVDVVAATDHDVVTTYESTLAALSAGNRLVVLPGVEQTPNILWFPVPGEEFPKTLGHFNFWPLISDPIGLRNGAPWDELREPRQLMDDIAPLFDPALDSRGVRQINHPFIDTKLGRDQGFLRAINYDPRTPIAPGASFAADVLLRRGRQPTDHRNLDWDVQEVMTGASRADWLRFRALWFSMLSQGHVRAGTANSDTHSLAIERAGYPRNLVFGGHDKNVFDTARFDADVRAGHMIGTNGPVLDVTIADADGTVRGPDVLRPLTLPSNGTLSIRVSAAPWIPVTQIRVFVNGVLAATRDVSRVFEGSDHLGTTPRTAPVSIQLSTIMPAQGDAWLVVEAGLDQQTPPDTDGDGLPDLSDADLPARPAVDSDPRFDLEAIAPGIWPTAFSNPFLIDLDRDGEWTAPGL
jgi:hypothetical protein